MANPLSNEKEIYEKIAKEKLKIPSAIWELLEHHLGNDLYAISMIVGSHIVGDEKEAIPLEDGEKIIKHVGAIKAFLNKLSNVAREG